MQPVAAKVFQYLASLGEGSFTFSVYGISQKWILAVYRPLQYIINALSSTQVYPNGESGDNSQGGANADVQEREVQGKIDSAPPDVVIYPLILSTTV